MAISRITLPNGNTYDLEEEGDFYLYCSCDIQSGADDREIVLFNYDETDNVAHTEQTSTAPARDATEYDTNIVTKGAMGDDESMSVFSIRVAVQEWTVDNEEDGGTDDDAHWEGLQPLPLLQNLARLDATYLLRLNLQGLKPYERHTLGFFTAGYGPTGFIAGTTASNYGHFGVASHAAARRIAIPHILPPTETYEVVLVNAVGRPVTFDAQSVDVPETGTQERVKVTLLGPRMRQVGRSSPDYPIVITGLSPEGAPLVRQ